MPQVSYSIDADFPGGNIIVESLSETTAKIRPDLRDTQGSWFYWCFRVRGAEGRTIRFEFTAHDPVGVRGPAISTDGGWTWRWLGRDADTSDCAFTYSFSPGEREVIFGMATLYTQRHLERFLSELPGRSLLQDRTLCITRKGREVPAFILGEVASVRHRVIITARHHCCEMIASYELEGILEAMTGSDELGRWYQQNVAAFVVPFVDRDGVEDGDQGKNRRPRDHNRDYDRESVHVETAAMRKQLPEWLAGRQLDAFLDLHCPGIRGNMNEHIYQVGSPFPEIWAQQRRFAQCLERVRSGPIPYQASFDLPFGQSWNVPANNSAGMTSGQYAASQLKARLSGTIELPYANSSGVEVTCETARAFGRDVAKALRAYLEL